MLTDIPSLRGQNEFSAILFKREGKGYVFVFRLGESEQLSLNLDRYFKCVSLDIGYGATEGKKIRLCDNILNVTMPKKYSAMIIEIKGE